MAYEKTEIVAPVGINKDLSPYELPPEVWSDARNVNFRRNRVNKQKGYTSLALATAPVADTQSTSISPLFVTYFGETDIPLWIYGSEDTLMRTDGQAIATLATGFTATRDENWSAVNFNSVMVFNNPNDAPQYLPEPYDAVIPLPFWGTQAADSVTPPGEYLWGDAARCSVIRSYKNYLFALDCWDQLGVRYNNMVRWSSPAQLGDVPPSWDPDSPSEQAGLYSLADSPGRVLDGLTLGDYFVIYKTDSVWLVQFVGGQFNFSFRKLFGDEAGMLAKECVAEFEGKHFVLSTTGAYIHNGATKTEIMEPWVHDQFIKNVTEAQLRNTRVIADHENHEIWVYYTTKDSNSNWCDQALIWNWDYNKWTIRDLTGISYVAEGIAKIRPSTEDTWDADDTTWDSDNTSWGEDPADQPDTLGMVLADYNNKLLYLDESSDTQAGQVTTGWVQRIGIDFNEDMTFKYLTRVVPHIASSYPVQVTLYSSDLQTAAPLVEQTSSYDPNADWGVDCHITGRYIGLKVASDKDFQFNGYTLVWGVAGEQ